MSPSRDPAEPSVAATSGDRRALARAISLVEDDRAGAHTVLATLYPHGGNARVTGLTGAPGAGKSTLTDRLIRLIRAENEEVAVLAVDPSSPYTGGAILGDRVRMQDHIEDGGGYIRSMASRGHLGGIASATPKVLAVLDGADFSEILVETVGVGQAEVEIAATADTTIVVLNPGWGDSIQAAKAGLLEIGDVFAVNKADRPGLDETLRDLKQMLELGTHDDWWPPVVSTVATSGEGVEELWQEVQRHRDYLSASGRLESGRHERIVATMEQAIASELSSQVADLRSDPQWSPTMESVISRELDPWTAARRILAAPAPE